MIESLTSVNNLKASRIGLGCVTFGREIDKDLSFALMDYAMEYGIGFFDTASSYGNGMSEIIVGDWMRDRKPERGLVSIATKIPPPYDQDKIFQYAEASLKRLSAEAIDVLYFHSWHQSAESVEVLAAMDSLIRLGKVGKIGASNYNADQLGNALRIQKENGLTPIRFVQNNNNVAVRGLGETFRLICSDNNIHIVTYSPLGAGFLTGKYKDNIGKGTRFQIVPGHQEDYFHESGFRRLELLQKTARRLNLTVEHLALAWAFHQPEVYSTLIGVRRKSHIDQAIAAISYNDPEVFAELE